MKVLSRDLVKEAISNQILLTRESLVVCTYSTDISSVEYYHFINLIENNVHIDMIVGKMPNAKVLSNFAKLFNIRIYFHERVHAKIYINETTAIATSCNFGRLNVQKAFECGIHFEKSEYPSQYKELNQQVQQLMSEAQLIMPKLPFRISPIDLRTFF